MRTRNILLVLATLMLASSAFGAEPERVVVRNRLYNPEGQIELGVEAGMSVINRLVSTDNFQVTGAYNFTNEWAVELFGGYALSGHTDIADQVNSEVASKPINTFQTVDDFAGLWEMKWNVAAGARWAPIYGKLNLFADLPVHFQAYIAGGPGVAGLERKSVTYCTAAPTQDADGNTICDQPLDETRVAPMGQVGGGLRFWLGPKVILRLEARDYFFPDKYQINIDRQVAQSGVTDAGQEVGSPGFENIVFLSAGLSFVF